MILFALLLASAAAPSGPHPLAPLGTLISAADYPLVAKAQGVTGKVGFRLRVDTSGKPDGCVVSETSGSRDLDDATCDLMLARARFQPARGSDGAPTRGNYSTRVMWMIESEPEAVANEMVRVRSELDATGKVLSCSATPAETAAEFGGCSLFGDPRMLGHLTNQPIGKFAWIEVRMIKQASAEAPVADDLPDGAVRNVLARSTVTISPAGAISGCVNDVVARIDGRALDLCAIGQADPNAGFAPAKGQQARVLTVTMETVTRAR